jgi:hypothetical protein
MTIDPRQASRPTYVVESKLETLKHGGRMHAGTKAAGCPDLYLFKLPLDATEVEIRGWRPSIHNEDPTNPRVSPSGQESWWISMRGSKASWPKTGERSNGKALKR